MKNASQSKWGFFTTGEYNGGVLGGFGYGMFVMAIIVSPNHHVTEWIYLLAGGCVITGQLFAVASKRKRLNQYEHVEKPVD